MKKVVIALIVVAVLAFGGCSASSTNGAGEDGQLMSSEQSDGQTADFPKNVTLDEALEMIAADDTIHFIDVRTEQEYNAGHVPGAKLLPLDQIESEIENKVADKAEKIIVYCRSGNRSGQAQRLLQGLGYESVCDAGGIINYSGEIEK